MMVMNSIALLSFDHEFMKTSQNTSCEAINSTHPNHLAFSNVVILVHQAILVEYINFTLAANIQSFDHFVSEYFLLLSTTQWGRELLLKYTGVYICLYICLCTYTELLSIYDFINVHIYVYIYQLLSIYDFDYVYTFVYICLYAYTELLSTYDCINVHRRV